MFLGDSITAFGDCAGSAIANCYSWGWSAQAVFLSKGRINQIMNAGIPGNTLQQMLDRFPGDVVAFHPAKVIIMGGTNDVPNVGTHLNEIVATASRIIDAAFNAGIQPVLCGIPPRTDTSQIAQYAGTLNASLRQLAANRGIVFVDFNSVLNNGSNGWKPGYSLSDNVHPSAQGARAMANLFVSTTAMIYSSNVWLPWVNSSAENPAGNALEQDGSTWWWSAGYGTAPAPRVSVIPGDSTIVGNWLQAVFPPATGAGQYYSFNHVNISATQGHTYELSFRYRVSGCEANGCYMNFSYGYWGPYASYYSFDDVADGVFHIVMQAGVNGQMNPGFVIYPTTNSSPVTVLIGQFGIRDLSQ